MSTASGELKQRESPRLFLDEAYRSLGYKEGILLDAVKEPGKGTREDEEWLEKGDWLALAKEVNAEKVFFVNNDPVIVFCELRDIATDEELRDKKLLETYRRVWCMARPICLFIAFPGELRVYSLNKPPTQSIEMWREIGQLAIVEKVAEVAEKLRDYRREEVESGRLFADDRFGTIDQRADKRLIQDLKTVRQALLDADLDAHYAHALIGRSIFIRYLEDRQVLTPEYFEQIADRNHKWKEVLRQPELKSDLTPGEEKRLYNRVLRDKDFTYALFKQLSEDFNGDMFPKNPNEEKAVDQEQHLERLRKFLLGDPDPQQPTLFFWAYDFKIIPIELISSIYEEFYHVSKSREDTGTHYTPGILVEYILSQILNEECLDRNPRILDPACGSGIFLVESFRRIVRHYVSKQGYLPPSPELREILRNQIIGIEINEEAVHVAAFSLYLALLHYQEPADILKTKPLPHLIYQKHQKMDNQHFQVLFHANAFGLTQSEEEELRARVVREKKGRANILRLLEAKKRLDINLHSFDVVVGNPPWSEGEFYVSCDHLPFLNGVPKPFKYSRVPPHILSASGEILERHVFQAKQLLPKEFHPLLDQLKTQSDECFQAIRWALAYNMPVGDKSYAQLFVYRALSFVKEDGVTGLLLHANILFNQSATSRGFRQAWLSSARIRQVMNFVRVRNLFFGNAIAPFIFACFEPRQATARDNYVLYNTAQRTKAVERLHTVILTKADRRLIRQSDFENRDYLWKTYAWGNQQDAALLAALSLEDRLQDVLERIESKPGFGFQRGDESPSQTLQNLRSLQSKNLTWYGPLRDEWFEEQPRGIKRDPNEIIYRGQRLIVVRGAKAFHGICVRLEYQDFSFRHTIYGIPLTSLPEWQAKLIVGTIWSSLGRYRLFMTAGKWGLWHDEVGSQDILSIPIRLPNRSNAVVQAISNAVDDIRAWNPHQTKSIWSESIFSRNIQTHPPMEILEHLDNSVFDLFELSESEQDLIRDFARYKFDLFSNGADAEALRVIEELPQTLQGTMQTLANEQETQTELERYIDAFLDMWNRELEPDGEFVWRIIRPSNVPIICVIFTIQKQGARLPTISLSGDKAWRDVLMRFETLSQPVSRSVYIDSMARVVTDTDIFIVKRDERRLWTRSMAREDAEATLLQAMNLQEAVLER
jgi:hypothetical protein